MHINETHSGQLQSDAVESTVWGSVASRSTPISAAHLATSEAAAGDAANVQLSSASGWLTRALAKGRTDDDNRVASLASLYHSDKYEHPPVVAVAQAIVLYSLEALRA